MGSSLHIPQNHVWIVRLNRGVQPIPEPGTMMLLGSLATGLFGMAGLKRRFRK